MPEEDVKRAVDETVDSLRIEIKEVARKVKALTESLKAAPKSNDPERAAMDSEVIAQSILSYRHLEDASMRLGKVKQYNNEGESVYDKNVVGSK
jgi:FtsZ-binding cell division protein ZapB